MKRVFIGGMGRSGTTIGLNAFYHHSELFALPVETKFLVEADGFYDLYQALTSEFCSGTSPIIQRRFFDLMRNQVTGNVPSPFLDQSHLPSALFRHYDNAVEELAIFLDKKVFFESGEPLLAAIRRFLFLTFDDLAAISNKTGWVEKTPSNIWRFEFLRALYPESYFVHYIRDPRNIFISLLEKGWLSENFSVSLMHFTDMMRALILKRRKIMDSSKFIEVKLEDLEKRPHETLQGIVSQIGLARYSKEQIEAVVATINTYHRGKKEPLELTTEQRIQVDDALMPMVIELGYSYNYPVYDQA